MISHIALDSSVEKIIQVSHTKAPHRLKVELVYYLSVHNLIVMTHNYSSAIC